MNARALVTIAIVSLVFWGLQGVERVARQYAIAAGAASQQPFALNGLELFGHPELKHLRRESACSMNLVIILSDTCRQSEVVTNQLLDFLHAHPDACLYPISVSGEQLVKRIVSRANSLKHVEAVVLKDPTRFVQHTGIVTTPVIAATDASGRVRLISNSVAASMRDELLRNQRTVYLHNGEYNETVSASNRRTPD